MANLFKKFNASNTLKETKKAKNQSMFITHNYPLFQT